MRLSLLLGCIQASTLCLLTAVAAGLPPVVVVPGLGGSVLEAKLHGRPPYRDCVSESGWYTIWASLVQGAARYACFIQDISLISDGESGVSNFTGVQIRPRDFGGTGGIEYSNAGTLEPPIAYMHKLVSRLEAEGYKAGVSLRAATNDFRSAGVPQALEVQYQLLRNLVEETYALNNDSAVHLLSHSLGGSCAPAHAKTRVSPPRSLKGTTATAGLLRRSGVYEEQSRGLTSSPSVTNGNKKTAD